jgi:hypothetical protein
LFAFRFVRFIRGEFDLWPPGCDATFPAPVLDKAPAVHDLKVRTERRRARRDRAPSRRERTTRDPSAKIVSLLSPFATARKGEQAGRERRHVGQVGGGVVPRAWQGRGARASLDRLAMALRGSHRNTL